MHEHITKKNFSIAFAAANEVADNLSGDCTEHSVLAAAMCRAVGIPSRVVIGLVYVKKETGFGFHMWVEVYVNQRWVAIDPTWKQSTVDAAHIKISESSLDGVAPIRGVLADPAGDGQAGNRPDRVPVSLVRERSQWEVESGLLGRRPAPVSNCRHPAGPAFAGSTDEMRWKSRVRLGHGVRRVLGLHNCERLRIHSGTLVGSRGES